VEDVERCRPVSRQRVAPEKPLASSTPRPRRGGLLSPCGLHKPIYRSTAMKVAVVFCGLPDYLQAKLNLPRFG
jgi:hypothetical protein